MTLRHMKRYSTSHIVKGHANMILRICSLLDRVAPLGGGLKS